MKRPKSERPASASRPARRSLTEFTTPAAANSAAIRLPPAAGEPRARSAGAVPPVERNGGARDDGGRVVAEPVERRVIAKPRSAGAGDKINNAMVENDAMARPIDKDDDVRDDASAAAEAAKDYRSAMFEHMKANLNATLDYANGLASIPTEVASRPADKADLGGAGLRENIPTATKAAEDYRAKAFELMKANVNATLEFGQSLAKAKSPAECVELSTNHACKQLGVILNQTNELVLMAQTMATANVERMAAGFAKVIGGKKE
jgi:Phasin protein